MSLIDGDSADPPSSQLDIDGASRILKSSARVSMAAHGNAIDADDAIADTKSTRRTPIAVGANHTHASRGGSRTFSTHPSADKHWTTRRANYGVSPPSVEEVERSTSAALLALRETVPTAKCANT